MRAKHVVWVAFAFWALANAQPSADGRSATQMSARAAMLDAFRRDIAVCKSIVKLLKIDRAFIASFTANHDRAPDPFELFLSLSSHHDSTALKYVVRNQPYLHIGVSNHGEPMAVAWVEDEAIYCAPTFARLKEIEALGESTEAWTIRQFFLDKALRGLEHPSDEITDGKVDFELFRSLVTDADRLYTRNQRPGFIAWTQVAAKTLEAGRKHIEDGASGRSAAEQNNILDAWISFLRSIAAR